MKKSSFDILSSPNRVYADFPGSGTVDEILGFGFSFVEQQDHVVEYVIVNPEMAKRIISEIPESRVVSPSEGVIGTVWTADIMVSNKVRDNDVVFSNGGQTAVLFLSAPKIEIR